MNKKSLLALFLASMTMLSACVSATDYSFQQNETESASYISEIENNRDNYAKCLFASSFFIKEKFGFSPRRDKIIEDCKEFGQEYYKSVYYAAWQSRGNVPVSHRTATALKALKQIELQAFSEAEAGE